MLVILVIVGLRMLYVRGIVIFALLGLAVFVATRASGIHTTIAGVALGFIVPARPIFSREGFVGRAENLLGDFREAHRKRSRLEEKNQLSQNEYDDLDAAKLEEESALARLDSLITGTEAPVERAILLANPWVSYLVLPLFALANAGLKLSGDAIATAGTSVVAWGVFAGLLFGKPIGILAGAYVADRAQIASMPKGVDWWSLTGMSMLAGIGFTVSLFIAELAFPDAEQLQDAKIGILAATLLSALLGVAILIFRPKGHA
jgi:NhaA family Na+:H+ antiporter